MTAEDSGTDRRGFVQAAVAGAGAGKFSLAPIASARVQESMHQPWWPSRWGPEDEAGATNHMTPEKVLASLRTVQDGRVYQLDRGEEIRLQDVRDALARQSMREEDIQAGDAILLPTGWGSLWMQNNDRYNRGEPDLAFVVHGHLQTKHGIVNREHLTFDELLADRRYQFGYMLTPAPLQGATGSCGCPIAIT